MRAAERVDLTFSPPTKTSMKNSSSLVLYFKLLLLIHFNNGSELLQKCLNCLPPLPFDDQPKIYPKLINAIKILLAQLSESQNVKYTLCRGYSWGYEYLLITHGSPLYPSHLECVADFLLLTKKEIRTEIFAEKTGGNWLTNNFNPKWRIGRRIVLSQAQILQIHNDEQSNKNEEEKWHIYETEMVKLFKENGTRKCFAVNHEFIESRNGKKFLNVSKILMEYNSAHFELSSGIAAKLAGMESCILEFLAKNKPLENILYETAPDHIRTAENAIRDKFKMIVNRKFATLRWNRHENDKLDYQRGTNEFHELEKCQVELFGEKHAVNELEIDANKMLDYFNSAQLYLQDYPYVYPSKLECVADYLLLTKKGIRTQIFALNEGGHSDAHLQWKIGRRIEFSEKQLSEIHSKLGDWEIFETGMAELLGETRARNCFAQNHDFIEGTNIDGQQQEQHFLSMSKIVMDSNSPYLNLSNSFAKRLDSMQSCLLEFMAKYISFENILNEAVPNVIRNAKDAIREKFSMIIHQEFATLRWQSRENDNEKLIYHQRETNEFSKLEKCQIELFGKKLVQHKKRKFLNRFVLKNELGINAKELLDYFNAEQLFLKDYPSENTENFIMDENTRMTGSNSDCSICLMYFDVNESITRVFPCKHEFHGECLQNWIAQKKNTCPLCRAQIKLEFEDKKALAFAQMQQQNRLMMANAMMNFGI